MDAIDGGMWLYGDSSYPQAERTVFGGTFCQHPMAMITAHAVLKYLQEQGPELQARLNQRTVEFAGILNIYFTENEVPMRIDHFGSLFRFAFSGNLELFFYHMLVKGVYIWEWRNCFLSTAHTDDDVDCIIQAAKESIRELGEGGFLQLPGIRTNSTPTTRVVPLNEAQKQLWALAQIGDEESLTYNTYATLKLRGSLRLKAMQAAVGNVIKRHEALRTTIDPNGLLQVVHPALEIDIPIIDFSHVDENERAEKIRECFIQESQTPFDLHHGPLFRLSFVKLAEEIHLLALTAHHIVVDGWSTSVILRELGDFYSAACRGETLESEQPLQLSDFIAWQDHQSWTKAMAKHETYWLKKFAGEIPVLNLPTDLPYPSFKTYNGARHTIHADERVGQDAAQVGKQHGCTRFMVLFSVYAALLHRLTGQADIVIGIPVLGRPPQDGDMIVAYCTHLLPVCSHLSEDANFIDFLKSIRGALLDGYEHQDYPFSKLIEKLNVRADVSRSPLVSAIFNLDQLVIVPEMFGLEIELFAQPISFTAYDLNLNVTEIGDLLVLDCDYNTELFDHTTIERFLAQFNTILDSIITDPQTRVTQLPLLTEPERHRILVEWNDTARDYPLHKCLHTLFEEQVERTPDTEAVMFEGQTLTYREFNARANQLAHYLQTQRVEPDTLVGICMERSLEMVIGIYGILKAGGAYVPIDPDYPKERIAFMLDDSQISVLLTQENVLNRVPITNHTSTIINLDTNWERIATQKTDNPISGVKPAHLAYVIYTSGSTGQPKGAMNTHQGICNRLLWMQDAYHLTSEDSVLQKTPFSFDVSVWEFYWPLMTGARLVVAKPGGHQDSTYLVKLIAEQKITTIHFVPSMLQIFVEEPGLEACHALRQVICSGEALPFELQERFFARSNAQLHNLYGPTEAAVDVTFWQCERNSSGRIVPIGRPIANTQIYIVDKHLQSVPVGVPGELLIGGIGLARGYSNRDELTLEKFIPNLFSSDSSSRLYKTGDLARFLPDGTIEYLGRFDHQVKIHGFRIELGEIESILAQHSEVKEVVVLARADRPASKQLIAYLVAKNGVVPPDSELKNMLKSKLPEYMIPSVFVRLEAFPLNPNGKIDRRALPASEVRTSSVEVRHEALSPTEELLTDIWAKTLGLEKVGIHENFFELSGDSILGIQIVSRANQAGLQLTPRLLFHHPTVAELAAVAGSNETIRSEQGIVSGAVPLTPVQYWFFEQNLAEPHHFNQSVLLEVPVNLKPELLQQAVRHLLNHHDALRLRFEWHEAGWEQLNAEAEEAIPFLIQDVSSYSAGEQNAAIVAIANEQQASLNLSKGPLMRVVLFLTGSDRSGRLLILIHHLTVDGVSWRILSEDLQTSYQQLERGEKVTLPRKTTSFKQWAQRLTEYAHAETLHQEMEFWQADGRPELATIPVDFSDGENTVASARTFSTILNAQGTKALLHEVPDVYHTQINDVLLTALIQTFDRWTENSALLLDIEGHGREDIFEDIDLSRTVGWFTSIFPVLLRLPVTLQSEEMLKSVKEQLRKIPNRGLGYGVLRYLNPATSAKLQAFPRPEILFNYMGQFDQMIAESPLFEPAVESSGQNYSPKGRRSHLIEVIGTVIGGELQMNWVYSEHLHTRATIEGLAQDFLANLQNLIAHCQSPETGGYTPSDFPLANMDESQLGTLSMLLGQSD